MQGEFSINIPKQISGTIIKVTQKEENKLKSAEIKIEVRKTRLNKLTINSVNSNDTYITGKAEKYAQIKLVISGRAAPGSNLEISRNYNTYNINTDSAGNWNYNFNGNLQANDEIKVRQYVNNTWSDYVYKRVVQLPAKNNITIDPINTSQRIVKGKGEPGAKVQIYDVNQWSSYDVDVDNSRKLEL